MMVGIYVCRWSHILYFQTTTEFEADEMEVVGARDAEQEERDYEEYRRQLEGDKEMRKNVRAMRICLDVFLRRYVWLYLL